MTIQHGLIWDFYDCSYQCYLFGKYNLPCFVRTISILFIWNLLLFGIIVIIYFIKRKFTKGKDSLPRGEKDE